MQGIETREVIKDVNKEQAKAGLKPGNVPQAAIMSPQPANLSHVGDGSRMIAKALDMAVDYANDRSKEQAEADYTNGQIMRYQGKAYKDAQDAGGYIGDGWQIADVQITATDMLNEQRGIIKGDHYASTPEHYRDYLAKYSEKIDQFAKSFEGYSPVVQKAIGKTKLSMLETLAEEQAKAHIEWNYSKTVDSIPKLMESALASGDANAIQQVKDYMKPGAFHVDPKDAQNAVKGWLDYKAESAQTAADIATLHEINASWNAQNGLPPEAGWHVPKHITINPPSLPNGSATGQVSMEIDGQAVDQAGMSVTDILSGGQGGQSTKSGPRGSSLDKGMAQAQQRVARNVQISAAVQTGDFSGLTTKEQETAFGQLQMSVAADVGKQVPMNSPEFNKVFQDRYTKAISKVAVVDKELAGKISANLVVSAQNENKTEAQWAANMLNTIRQNGGTSQALKYVTADQKDQASRILSYMDSGMDSQDAVNKASQVQAQVDSGTKAPKVTETEIKKALKDLQDNVETHEFSILNPWNYVPMPFGDTSQSRWSYGMTPDELNAPSPEKSMLTTSIETLAKQYMPTAHDAGAAVRKAVHVLEPRVQYVAAKPLIAEQPWEEKLNASAPEHMKLAKGTLEKDPTIFNAAIMEAVKAQASVFQRDRDSFWGHVFKEGVSTYKTFRGENNSLVTFARGIPDYRNLAVHMSPDGNGVTVHTFKDGQESPEYVFVSTDLIRRGIQEIQIRDAKMYGTAAGITPIMDRPKERDTPNTSDQARGTVKDRMQKYISDKVQK